MLQSLTSDSRTAEQSHEPEHSITEGMSLWILQHVLGFQMSVRDDADPSYEFGMSIVNHCDFLLRGDFAIRSEYDALEQRILDRMDDVRSLPDDHAIRLMFDARNIQWLTEIERSEAGWADINAMHRRRESGRFQMDSHSSRPAIADVMRQRHASMVIRRLLFCDLAAQRYNSCERQGIGGQNAPSTGVADLGRF